MHRPRDLARNGAAIEFQFDSELSVLRLQIEATQKQIVALKHDLVAAVEAHAADDVADIANVRFLQRGRR